MSSTPCQPSLFLQAVEVPCSAADPTSATIVQFSWGGAVCALSTFGPADFAHGSLGPSVRDLNFMLIVDLPESPFFSEVAFLPSSSHLHICIPSKNSSPRAHRLCACAARLPCRELLTFRHKPSAPGVCPTCISQQFLGIVVAATMTRIVLSTGYGPTHAKPFCSRPLEDAPCFYQGCMLPGCHADCDY